MSEAGHVTRVPNPADGRSTLIELSDKGVDLTAGCFPAFRMAIDAFREQLTEEFVTEHELLRVLEGASRAIAAASQQLAAQAVAS
jgi:DNA-binding MarR family transcriptional regulator